VVNRLVMPVGSTRLGMKRRAFAAVVLGLMALREPRAEPSQIQVIEVRVAGSRTGEPVEVTLVMPELEQPVRRPIAEQDFLPLGAEMIVPTRTVFRLQSPNGTECTLSPGARYRVDSTSARGEMHSVLGGTARFHVSKLLDFFNVEFKGFVGLVRGTEFTLRVDPGRDVQADLKEGRLRIGQTGKVRISEGARESEVLAIKILEPGIASQASYALQQESVLQSFATNQEAEDHYRAQLESALAGGDFDLIEAARNDLGSIFISLGHPQAAAPQFSEGAAAAQARNDKPWEARMLNNLGTARYQLRDFRGAIQALQRALSINLELYPVGIQRRIAHNYNNLGLAYRGLGDMARSIEYFEKALKTNQLLPADDRSRQAAAGNYENLGETSLKRGDKERGFEYLERALKIRKALPPAGRHPDLGVSYNRLGIAYEQGGDLVKAEQYHTQALTLRRQLYPDGRHPTAAESHFHLGRVLCRLGNCKLGIRQQEEALALALRLYPSGIDRTIAIACRSLAEAWRREGDQVKAADYQKRAEQVEARLQSAP